jgi:RNA polymerase sigma factor (sigma-70 family)
MEIGSVSKPGRERSKRSYRPRVEGLEPLRLLASAASLPMGVPIAIDPSTVGVESGSGMICSDAWDAALLRSQVADLLGPSASSSTSTADADAIVSGLGQLDRYLNRAWYRAGIAPQQHDDCTQAVYTTLLQSLGRDRFDGLLTDIGQSGIRDVLSRETPEGPDFFRAIDTVKKRAQREKTFQPIDAVDVADASIASPGQADWRGALQEAIEHSLNPREAALIQATIQGETPAEIAQRWGVAPKTVSNEKSRALQKLRDALGADLDPGERPAPGKDAAPAEAGEAAGDGPSAAGGAAASAA